MAKKMFGKRILAAVLSLVLVCNLLPMMGAMAAENEIVNTVQNFEDTYYKQDGSVGSANDWEVHLSKTAQPTDEENVFDITLKVQTKDTFTQVASTTDGAAVLVLDVSNSMDDRDSSGCTVDGCGKSANNTVHCTEFEKRSWSSSCKTCGERESAHHRHHAYQESKTRLENLQAAVAAFLDVFASDAAAGEKRMIAVAVFGTDAVTIQDWVDITSDTARKTLIGKINSLSTGNGAYMGQTYLCRGGTNMEAGLVLGRNLLTSTKLAGIPTANQSLILFSDGEPTARVGDVSNTSTQKVTYGGMDTGSSTDHSDYDDISAILAKIPVAKIAVKYNYNDSHSILKTPTFTRVISSTADTLSVDLQGEAGKVITNKTNASTVTDPMGPGVSMISVSTGYNQFTEKWNLAQLTPVIANGITTYTITYRVEIDPTVVQLDPDYPGYTVLTPANGETTLNYTYGEKETAVSVGFNEPSIRGLRTFTVSYEYVGEVPADAPEVPDEEIYKAGTFVEVADAPTLENYTFSGWSKSDFVMPASDVTIVGTWSENAKYSYAIIYNANFGANETKADAENISNIYAITHSVTIDSNTFIRENHTFVGWNTKADGSGTAYAPGNVVGLTAEKNSAVLYAQWEENPKYSYSVTYNANFGAMETKADSENVTGVYATAWNVNVDASTFVRENYTFTGWNTDPNGNGTPYAANDVVDLTAEQNAVVLYAQWDENEKFEYSVIYDANFNGETKADSENISGTYATEYSIFVDGNPFVRANHTFLGWSDTANGEVVYQAGDAIRFQQGGSKILYAVWQENPKYDYAVIYNGNGGLIAGSVDAYGDSENMNQVYVTSFQVIVDGNAFTRANYTFLGWNTSADGKGTAYAVNDLVTLTAEENTLTLYAIWEENEKFDYTVTYDANFVEVAQRIDNESVTGVYDLTWTVTADENAFVRPGYTFTGWNTAADGTGTAYAPSEILNLASENNTLTLFAQWQINAYEYEVVYMVRVNGAAYEIFADALPQGAPVGGNADFGTVIDEAYMIALGLPAELVSGEHTFTRNAFEGVTIAEEGNVVTVS